MSQGLPAFTVDGLLPPGDFTLTFDEIRASFLVRGPRQSMSWDISWRTQLVENLEIIVGGLCAVGVHDIFIGGSFVEEKDHPNDIDGYFVYDDWENEHARICSELVKMDPELAPSPWRVDRYRIPRKSAMWHKYRVELYPHYGQVCGIVGASGMELVFPDAFRLSREGKAKGVVRIGGK
jgi:hypothetical protein